MFLCFIIKKIIYYIIFKSLKLFKIKFVFIWLFLSVIFEIFLLFKMIIYVI